MGYTSLEICAGGGGQALGLEQAGFEHIALVELDALACDTLKSNRPDWNVLNMDLRKFSAAPFKGVDLFAGGVPCPPFSIAGKQEGELDDRDLFPEAMRLIAECNPKAVILENVRGLLGEKFNWYRMAILGALYDMGYDFDWRVLNASDYGVPQLRPRAILVALKHKYFKHFRWPDGTSKQVTVGEALHKEMSSNGWEHADTWRKYANGIAPTLVGGSKKHGGADLGPTRARYAWMELCVDGRGLANHAPLPGSSLPPRLTLPMTAIVQGFPSDWTFSGKKTPAYRQVGNAFPPPVAKAVGISVISALKLFDDGKKNRGTSKTKTVLSEKRGQGSKRNRASRGSGIVRVGKTSTRIA